MAASDLANSLEGSLSGELGSCVVGQRLAATGDNTDGLSTQS